MREVAGRLTQPGARAGAAIRGGPQAGSNRRFRAWRPPACLKIFPALPFYRACPGFLFRWHRPTHARSPVIASSLARPAAPKAPPAIDTLLEALGEAVVVFNVAGTVRFANASARELLGGHLENFARHPGLPPLLRDCALGKATLPMALDLEFPDDGGKPLRVSGLLTPGTAGPDFAFVVPSSGRTGAAELPGRLVQLLRDDLLKPLELLLRGFAGIERTLEPRVREVLLRGSDVVGRVQKLADLIDLFGGEAIATDDRVALEPLVRRAWDEIAPLAASRRIESSLTGFRADLPPVYGNARLLARAMRECLENAVKHSREGVNGDETSHVEIRADLHGEHVRITVKNHGFGVLPAIVDREFLPFNVAQAPGAPARWPGLGIGLPLARRIVEIHGGYVNIGASRDETTELVMELPTGAPHREAGRQDIAQAQRYAEDLAKLMARRRGAPS